MLLILVILLVLVLAGGGWGYRTGYVTYANPAGIILMIIVVLLLLGLFAHPYYRTYW